MSHSKKHIKRTTFRGIPKPLNKTFPNIESIEIDYIQESGRCPCDGPFLYKNGDEFWYLINCFAPICMNGRIDIFEDIKKMRDERKSEGTFSKSCHGKREKMGDDCLNLISGTIIIRYKDS